MKQIACLLLDITFWIAGRIAKIIYFLLGWRVISNIGKIYGDVIYSFASKRKVGTEKELNMLFGSRFNKEKIKNITKRSFENYYRRQIETAFFGSLDKGFLDKIIVAEGLENLDLALSKGKGVILLLSHFGSFLLPLPFLGYRGYKVNQVTGRQINTSLFAERLWLWRKSDAQSLPVRFLQVDRFLRPIYRALKNNEIVAIAFDGRDSSKWIAVDFFGRRALFSSGPFELARKTSATIVPTFIIRRKNNTHKLFLEPPLKLTSDSNLEKAVYQDTCKFANLFASYINRYPCHFGMVLYMMKNMYESGRAEAFFCGDINEYNPYNTDTSRY